MTYLRMPIFCWTTLASNLLIVAAFPILTATLAMLLLDRYLGFHFFTNEAGGNPMMFMNLIWAWGHPEVYILVLPAFGIFSEVFATFSGKPLFGYRSMVAATMANLHPLLHGLAAPLLHHGRGRRRQRDLRHRHHDHRRAHGREDLQLAVHDVRRPRRLRAADAVGARLRRHLRHRRHDRRAARRAAGRLRAPQQPLPRRPLPQRHHRRRGVRRVRRLRVLVSQGVRLPPARGPGQGGVLVLDRRLLRRLHAALRARPDGHDAAHAALRRARVAAVAAGRRRRRGAHRRRRRAPGGAAGLEHSPPRGAARRDRRPVERAHARVDDALAAADVQLCGDAGHRGRGGVLDAQAERDRAPGAAARARISRHPHAAQQLRRLHLRLLLGHHGLRADLAHLVARRRGLRGRLGRVRRRRLARRARGGDPRGDRREPSTGPIAPPARPRCRR